MGSLPASAGQLSSRPLGGLGHSTSIGRSESCLQATLSQDFTINLHLLYQEALKQLVSPGTIRSGINCHTMHAAPTLMSAVAAVEAFINEVTLASPLKLYFKKYPWTLDQEWLQEVDVRTKLIIVPTLFGRSFERARQPYQDFVLLVKARNEVVHYKMGDTAPKYLKALQERGIALSPNVGGGELIWIHSLCCSEVIRWANNIVGEVARGLVALIPEQYHIVSFASMAGNFRDIGEQPARAQLEAAGLPD